MCGGMYIVIVNGKLAEIAGMNLFFLFGITTNCNCVRMLTQTAKNADAITRDIFAFFWPDNAFKLKNVNLGMISAMHTTNINLKK